MTEHLHIYRHADQPATRFKVDLFDGHRPMVFKRNPRAQIRASCCGQLRWAQNLTVQIYYDHTPYYCRDRKGCKA